MGTIMGYFGEAGSWSLGPVLAATEPPVHGDHLVLLVWCWQDDPSGCLLTTPSPPVCSPAPPHPSSLFLVSMQFVSPLFLILSCFDLLPMFSALNTHSVVHGPAASDPWTSFPLQTSTLEWLNPSLHFNKIPNCLQNRFWWLVIQIWIQTKTHTAPLVKMS